MIDSNIIPFMRETMEFTAINRILGDTFAPSYRGEEYCHVECVCNRFFVPLSEDEAKAEAKRSILQDACIVLVMISTIPTIS
jgi:hypothetical protein